jgi:hypothetical protein
MSSLGIFQGTSHYLSDSQADKIECSKDATRWNVSFSSRGCYPECSPKLGDVHETTIDWMGHIPRGRGNYKELHEGSNGGGRGMVGGASVSDNHPGL